MKTLFKKRKKKKKQKIVKYNKHSPQYKVKNTTYETFSLAVD